MMQQEFKKNKNFLIWSDSLQSLWKSIPKTPIKEKCT